MTIEERIETLEKNLEEVNELLRATTKTILDNSRRQVELAESNAKSFRPLTSREVFAINILNGVLSSGGVDVDDHNHNVGLAVELADTLIKRLDDKE